MADEVELSFVIPVFNGAKSITSVVEGIVAGYDDLKIEIVLVNDGSVDDSETVCSELQVKYPAKCTFVNLAKNFGEHNAVLAGLAVTSGAYVAVLDDDGQNPPEEVRKMYRSAIDDGWDAVYGNYRTTEQSRFRRCGSYFSNWVATILLKKPKDLYLSSFRVINRFLVEQVTTYNGAFPYIDGLILRSTTNISQVPVEHRPRTEGTSNYTLRRLVALWVNSVLSFSIRPLRLAAIVGAAVSFSSALMFVAIIVDKIYFNQDVAVGVPTILSTIVFFSGFQLLILGTIGEYLGRVFLDQSNYPQYVVRYSKLRTQDNE